MLNFYERILFKAYVRYFLSNFYFSPNDSPSKTMKNVFYFIKKALFILKIFKFLYFCLSLFFFLPAIALKADPRKILKFVINCLNKNLITHFVWYLDKEIRCGIETLSIDRELNKEHVYPKNHAENVLQKLAPNHFLILLNNPKQPSHTRNSFKNKVFWQRIIEKPNRSSGHKTSS